MATKKDKDKEKAKPSPALKMLSDPSAPFEHRRHVLAMVAHDDSEGGKAAVQAVFEAIEHDQGETVASDKAKKYAELMKQMEEGPQRYATFLDMLEPGGVVLRAHVVLEDGTEAFVVVPEEDLVKTLQRGDAVLLEGSGRALLRRVGSMNHTGEEAKYERRIDPLRVEVSQRGEERHVCHASQTLIDQLDKGEVVEGRFLIVNVRQRVAFDAVPLADGLSHFRYLDRRRPPDVIVERDVACPPAYIEELAQMIRLEMISPEVRRRYHLRRCAMRLLAGVSGGGKSLSVFAFWRRMYDVVSEVTGTPLDQLPPRVMRVRMAEVLSPWLGESDKNLDRVFDEAEQLAEEIFVAPDGKQYKLPLLLVLEEVDSLAVERGRDREGIHDRILTVALQRLDPTRPELADKLIIFIATTNIEQSIDPAFVRRIGGQVVRFGRLNRKSFAAVLSKHLRGLPLASNNGHSEEELQRQAILELTAWLFSPNGSDRGVLEVMYAGQTTPEVRYKRDLLTGALVDRAVQQAAHEACGLEVNGLCQGVTTEQLRAAFDAQLQAIADQVNVFNAQNYLTVPDGARVAQVRRIRQPRVNPIEFIRTDSTNHNQQERE